MKASSDGRDGSTGDGGLEKDCFVGVDGGEGSATGVEGPHWMTAHAFAARWAAEERGEGKASEC